MNKIIFLTESGASIGLGHVSRCHALAKCLVESECDVEIIVNCDYHISEFVDDVKTRTLDWLSNRAQILKDASEADVVIIDSYLADHAFYKTISEKIKLTCYIDDNNRIDYPKGIVINGNIHAESLDYPKNKEKEYLLGLNYFCLRKPFWKVEQKVIKEKIENILISLGGTDIQDITPSIIKILKENYPKADKKIVIGRGKYDIDGIKTNSDDNTELIFEAKAKEFKSLMQEADLAISAGGVTLSELASVGVPTVAFATVDNQINNVNGWIKSGFIKDICQWQDKQKLLDNISSNIDLMTDYEARVKASKLGQSLVDGKGCYRIQKFLCEKT